MTQTLGEWGGVNESEGVKICAFLLLRSALLHECEIIAFSSSERVLRIRVMGHKNDNHMYTWSLRGRKLHGFEVLEYKRRAGKKSAQTYVD